MKNIITIVLVVGLAGIGYGLFTQTGANMTYYYDTDDVSVNEMAGQRIKVSGIVQHGSVDKQPELLTSFVVTGTAKAIPVLYTGALPDIFRDGIQVVVTGEFDQQGTFQADELLAKCPSKYQAEGDRADFEHLDGYEIEYDHRKALDEGDPGS